MSLPSKPITRKEQYLAKAAGQDVEIPAKPITREEEYLDAIAKKPGGGGGTSDYEQLNNLPQINGVTLSGDKSASDLSLASANDLAGKQDAITAGLYIQMQNNEISVKRDISKADTAVNYVCNTVGIGSFTIKKYVNGEQVGSTIQYEYTTIVGAQNIDDVFTVSYNATTANWVITNTVASNEHPAGYEKTMFRSLSAEYSQTFVVVLDADKKLIIQSELDAAVNAIKDGQNIDSFADVETALAGKADLTDLAPAFSTATAYTVGQYVSYGGNIYKCTSAHSAGAWAAGDFTLVAVGSELESKQNATDNNLQTTNKTVVGAVNELKSGLTNIGILESGIATIDLSEYTVAHGNSIYYYVISLPLADDIPIGIKLCQVVSWSGIGSTAWSVLDESASRLRIIMDGDPVSPSTATVTVRWFK